MIECNDLYDYGYYIFQNSDYFKFSLDSILLAEYVHIKKNMSILDLCTGNAPIPMILTSKEKTLEIDAVELQDEIYKLAKMSVEKNGFDNINIINADVKNFDLNKTYDVITCNPPYFKVKDTSILNDNEIKKIQRHEIKLNLEDVVNTAYKHLKEDGTLYMVHRTDRLIDVIGEFEKKKLGIRSICFIYTKNNKNAEFFIIEGTKNKKSDPKVISKIVDRQMSYKNIFEEV